jgi:hypothetical protein
MSLVGVLMTAYFFLFFDASVPGGIGGGRTINLGLMADRQNGIIVGLGLAILGIAIAIATKLLAKDPEKAARAEGRIYGGTVLGIVSLFALIVVGSLLVNWFESAKDAWEQQNKKPPVVEITKSDDATIGTSQASTSSTPGSTTGAQSPTNSTQTPANSSQTPASSSPTGTQTPGWGSSTNWGGSTIGSGSTTTPNPASMAVLQQQNTQLANQIKTLQQNNLNIQTALQSQSQRLSDTKKAVNDRDAEIQRLENNLRISDETIRAKDRGVDEMRTTLERWKNGASSENQGQSSTVTGATRTTGGMDESLDAYWPNVRDFRPAIYKGDVERRLYRISGNRRLAESGMGAEVQIHFTIAKDGQPTNILLVTPIEDEETKKRCVRYIQAAGPFRPLLSNDLDGINVDAEFVQPADAQVHIGSLQIAAMGNKL